MYSVELTNKGNSTFLAKVKDYEFTIDTKGRGVTPPDALLASLGSCIGVYLKKYAEGAGLQLAGFTVKVDADFCKEPPIGFKRINVSIALPGADLDDRRKRAVLMFLRNCPVHNTLKGNPEVEVSIT